ncbi:ABC transporter ATP-binding protein [Tropicimonas sp. TH_r6]|uniref:ABC transporter ATP-binding protein n=1 Tax=Tropicimonas sp. TH_r6 TaxID=3082085 RepID=UPI002954ABD2|nr:ABC transporter ATP-binding protein [Tropicimonas sp. TH_r6]MDV7145162.1 ABC transporter ATP-binding protein [Tropicimonas sp. TH_r6]
MVEAGDQAAIRVREMAFGWAGPPAFRLGVADFTVAAGETVFLLGESGSGKSTFLSLICGINRPQQGRVEIAGKELSALRAGQRDRFRAENIGVIFQMFNLLPYAGALDNILLPLRFAPERRKRVGDARAEAMRLATALGLPSDLVEHGPAAALSTGQQQRVAVARALIGQPPLIVADEPTSALDAGAQAAFLELLFEQVRAVGSTLLMVSHDARLADRFDRQVQLSEIARIERGAR